MKKTFLGLVLAVVSATGYAQKDARIQEIRSAYANAKAKMSKNGKDGQSPRDLWIERNDVIDKAADVTEWEGTTIYFESDTVDGREGRTGQPTSTHGIARC